MSTQFADTLAKKTATVHARESAESAAGVIEKNRGLMAEAQQLSDKAIAGFQVHLSTAAEQGFSGLRLVQLQDTNYAPLEYWHNGKVFSPLIEVPVDPFRRNLSQSYLDDRCVVLREVIKNVLAHCEKVGLKTEEKFWANPECPILFVKW